MTKISQFIIVWGTLLLASAVSGQDENKNNTYKEYASKEEYIAKNKQKREIASSFAMEYIPIGHVRTDPIITQDCLSDHVHTFYGPPKVHPSVTYEELRSTTDNIPHEATSGNVLENQSLYWHPTFYRLQDNGSREIVEPDWTTIYYAFQKGETKSFPEGFRMIADSPSGLEMVCYNNDYLKSDDKGESTTTDEDMGSKSYFPSEACEEMTASLVFPTCWDGKSVDSDNHRDHVAYAINLESGKLDTFGYEGVICPESHPVLLPQILLFLRFMDYKGQYELSNGNGVTWHADYMMGWEEAFLQDVMDGCDELKDIPCGSTRLRDIYGSSSEKGVDSWSEMARFLQTARVPMVNTSCITEESVNQIEMPPRGGCKGDVLSVDSCVQPELPIEFFLNNHAPKRSTSASVATSTVLDAVIFLVSTIFAIAMN